ncbi:MAG TPA: hypothetical protein VE465_12890, partial [Streptosporangiaceae bacterium]|nr:hypothetical protein [Streptosporangiaceae bacterium]
MKDGVRIGMAVGLGYLLGRTRKGRMALMLVGVGMTGRAAKNPAALVKQGIDVLGSSPEVKTLTETVRGRLVEAGKGAMLAVVARQVESLADRLSQRLGLVADAAEAPRSMLQETVRSDRYDSDEAAPQPAGSGSAR